MEDEEEEEPIHIEASEGPNDHTISLCLIGKLWTTKSYNVFSLMETMKKIWHPLKGVTCREMGNNMISFEFQAKGDMQRVLSMEPWHFNKHALVLKQASEVSQPSELQFDTIPFWIRLYDLPFIGRDEKTSRIIGGRFGEVMEIDKNTIGGMTKSIRLRVRIRIDKPVKRGTKIKLGNTTPCWIPITYERMPSFCYWCGMLGHLHKDCEQLRENEDRDESIEESEMPYGD